MSKALLSGWEKQRKIMKSKNKTICKIWQCQKERNFRGCVPACNPRSEGAPLCACQLSTPEVQPTRCRKSRADLQQTKLYGMHVQCKETDVPTMYCNCAKVEWLRSNPGVCTRQKERKKERKTTPMLPPAWIMVLLHFSSLSKFICNLKLGITRFQGVRRLLPPIEGDIALLNVRFLLCGPSKYNSGMLEKLHRETQI